MDFLLKSESKGATSASFYVHQVVLSKVQLSIQIEALLSESANNIGAFPSPLMVLGNTVTQIIRSIASSTLIS